MNKKVKVGIVGLGRAGFGMQCNELDAKSDKYEIVAGCDDFAPWVDRMKERYPSVAVYSKLEDLLKNRDVELVSIATRSVDHFKHSMMALEAGKDVLVEKPMCISYSEALKLQEALTKYKGNLYVRHNRRFDPDFLHVKEIVDSGILGKVHTIKLCRAFFAPRRDWQALKTMGGGQLLNWGPHIIDHALQFLGAPEKPIKDMWCDCKQLISGGDCEDHLKVVLKGADGCIADVEISSAAAIAEPEYVVWGTRGALALSLVKNKIDLKYLADHVIIDWPEVDEGVPGRTVDAKPINIEWIEKSVDIGPSKVINVWDELYNSLRNNKAFPITLEQAVEVMRIVSKVKGQ